MPYNNMLSNIKNVKNKDEEFICPITKEKLKIPVVDQHGVGYDYNSLKEKINEIIKDANNRYYKVPYRYEPQEVIIPNKTLATYLGIDIGAMKTEYYDIPKCKVSDCEPIYDTAIRDVFKIMDGRIPVDELVPHFQRLGIPVHKDGCYMHDDIVIMNLDLSGLVLNLANKGQLFYNCNFYGSQLKTCKLDRTQFNYCDLSDTILFDPSFRGEEVSFHSTDMDGLTIIGGCVLEKGITWNECTTVTELKQEFRNRGGVNTDTIKYYG